MEKAKLFRIWRNRDTGELSSSRLEKEYESTPLVYEKKTRIVYYKFSEFQTVVCTSCGAEIDEKVGFMTPYISENGKYCRYLENEIVEIP